MDGLFAIRPMLALVSDACTLHLSALNPTRAWVTVGGRGGRAAAAGGNGRHTGEPGARLQRGRPAAGGPLPAVAAHGRYRRRCRQVRPPIHSTLEYQGMMFHTSIAAADLQVGCLSCPCARTLSKAGVADDPAPLMCPSLHFKPGAHRFGGTGAPGRCAALALYNAGLAALQNRVGGGDPPSSAWEGWSTGCASLRYPRYPTHS